MAAINRPTIRDPPALDRNDSGVRASAVRGELHDVRKSATRRAPLGSAIGRATIVAINRPTIRTIPLLLIARTAVFAHRRFAASSTTWTVRDSSCASRVGDREGDDSGDQRIRSANRVRRSRRLAGRRQPRASSVRRRKRFAINRPTIRTIPLLLIARTAVFAHRRFAARSTTCASPRLVVRLSRRRSGGRRWRRSTGRR
jgi:hypothetical protein